MKRQIMTGITAVLLLTMMMIPVAAAYTPPCTCTPGRTPGFWKHNLAVALGIKSGAYSSIYDDVKLNYNDLVDICTLAGTNLQAAYDAVNTKGGGAGGAAIRDGMASSLNIAAGLNPDILV